LNDTLVMIPAYNEEETIRGIAGEVRALNPEYDVIVIDDGSSDSTATEARKAGAHVVTLPIHAGGTAAVLSGYLSSLKCGYRYLAKIDGDGQHRPEDVRRVLKPVVNDEVDVCVGSRYLGKTDEFTDSTVKTAGRAFSSQLMNNLVNGMGLTDVTSGLRAWNRRALKLLVETHLARGKFPDDSILWPVETILVHRTGLRIREIPIQVLPRLYGKSKSFTLTKMLKYPYRMVALSIEVLRSDHGL
jgi:glycosyltransferase involved in cell wall biosynthesis